MFLSKSIGYCYLGPHDIKLAHRNADRFDFRSASVVILVPAHAGRPHILVLHCIIPFNASFSSFSLFFFVIT